MECYNRWRKSRCDREGGFCIATDGTNVWVAGSVWNSTTNAYTDFVLIKYNCTNGNYASSDYPKKYVDIDGCDGDAAFQMKASCLVTVPYTAGTQCFIGGSIFDGTDWKIAVAKDNPTSSGFAWVYTYKGNSSGIGAANYHLVTDLKVSQDDTKVYVAGYVANTSSTSGKWDACTVVLDATTTNANGAVLSSWNSGAPKIYNNSTYDHNDILYAVDYDASGNVYVAGQTVTNTTYNYTDGLLIKYNSTGTQQWIQTFAGSGSQSDYWADIAVIGTSTSAAAVFVGGTAYRSSTGEDYALAGYNSNGGTPSDWSSNPVYYDGAGSYGNIDRGFGIDYSSNTSRVYIFGMADEGVSMLNYNISTVGFSGSSGSQVWGAAKYDCLTDYWIGPDEATSKYGLKVAWNASYCVDDIYVVGTSVISGNDNDYTTIKYSCGTCISCEGPEGEKSINTAYNTIPEFDNIPNPFSDRLEIVVSENVTLNNAQINVYDLSGRQVFSQGGLYGNVIVLSLGSLPTGMYYYTLHQQDIIIGKGKLIKE